jgi:hypothetical protein
MRKYLLIAVAGATGRRCTWNVRLLGCSGGAATDAFNKDVPEQLAGNRRWDACRWPSDRVDRAR